MIVSVTSVALDGSSIAANTADAASVGVISFLRDSQSSSIVRVPGETFSGIGVVGSQ